MASSFDLAATRQVLGDPETTVVRHAIRFSHKQTRSPEASPQRANSPALADTGPSSIRSRGEGEVPSPLRDESSESQPAPEYRYRLQTVEAKRVTPTARDGAA